jgi:hypothetical protein
MLAAPPTRTHTASRLSDLVPPRIASGRAASARIHSVHRSVVNVSVDGGLLAIASPTTGGLPNGILVDLGADFRTLGLRPGMAVVFAETGLEVPRIDLHIDLAQATRWSPRLRRPDGGIERAADRWRGRSNAAWAIGRDRAATGGLGTVLRDEPDDAHDLGVARRARAILVELRVALLAGDRVAAVRAARGLIGLGPGLTPSGDDLLAGIEVALHALGAPAAGFIGGALEDVDDRTTAVAATLLRHAASGEFAERFHATLAAFLAEDDAALPAAIDRAVAWGATSGTDSLLGMLVGLDIATSQSQWPT